MITCTFRARDLKTKKPSSIAQSDSVFKIVNYDKIKFTFLFLDIDKESAFWFNVDFMPIFMRQSIRALGRGDFYFRPYWQKRPLLAGKILILWKPKRNSIIENEYTGRYHFLFSH